MKSLAPRWRGRVVALPAAAVALAVVAAACAGGASPPLNVANGTTLQVTLVVNGVVVAYFDPGEGTPGDGFAGPLPPLPWTIAATSATGRVLTTMTVRPGDVFATAYPDGRAEFRSPMARVDLSCGRLDLWAGDQPPYGPVPGPGAPRDCEP